MDKQTINVELTSEQLEKVKLLEENGIGVGEAIEMLFQLKEQVHNQTNYIADRKLQEVNERRDSLKKELDKLDKEFVIFSKLKDSSLGFEQKQEILEKEYSPSVTYDEVVHDSKLKFSWMDSLFKL